MINDGFVSGSNTRDATAALAKSGCAPQPSKHGLSTSLHMRPRSTCPDALCKAARAVASTSSGAKAPELVLVVASSSQLAEVRLLLQSTKRASIGNLLLVVPDEATHEEVGEAAPPLASDGGSDGAGLTYVMAELQEATNPRDAAVARYRLISRLLADGFGVLTAAPSTVFLSNPFASLYRDADIEAMSSGWDDGSAYGYNHVLDDPSMGFTRFCHGSRIVSYAPPTAARCPLASMASIRSPPSPLC